MLRVLVLFLSLATLAGAGLYYRASRNVSSVPPAWPALERPQAGWLEANFQVGKKECPGDHFNFATGLVLSGPLAAPVRLAVHYRSPDDCLYVEIAGQSVSLVAARGGLHRTLAAAELAAPPAAGVEHALELRRRGALVAAVLDGQVAAMAFAESFTGGRAAVGCRSQGVSFRAPKLYELEQVLFLDDFMRPAEAPSAWQTVSGQWNNKGIRNPSMSANAFRFTGAGRPALTVTGQSFWDLYSFAASLQGAAGGQIGLVFAYRDDRNHCLFRWSARQRPLESSSGVAEIVRVADGHETVLQRAMIGYLPEQWYRAEVRLGWGWAEVSVDGHRLLDVSDPLLSGGAVGLWTSAAGETLFDDVRVAETAAFKERFYGPASTWSSWDFLGVDPRLEDRRQAEGLSLAGPVHGGLAVFGSSRWVNYLARAELMPQSGRCGLVYHYRDAANYSCLAYDAQAGRLEILSYENGDPRTLAAAEAGLSPGMHVFEVRLDRGFVRATVDAGHELVAWQTDRKRGGAGLSGCGRAGLAVWNGRALARSFTVELLAEIEPLPVVNPIFATDREMMTWSSWHGDWATDPPGATTPGLPRWHRARFAGDVTLLVEIAKIPENQYELALSVAKSGEKSKPGNGYILKLSRSAPAASVKSKDAPRTGGADKPPIGKDVPKTDGAGKPPPGTSLVLQREGRTVAEAPVPEKGPLWTLALRKTGPFVVGYLNSQEMFCFQDPEPLNGQKVAWYSRGLNVEDDGFRVYCSEVQNDTFDRAPVEWRSADGIWEVTNRWQCDPRWSFFSGRPASRKAKLAALWSKREYGDDVVLEFFAGIKMDNARGGNYQYARDINCTLSADGRDLASGYSFLFGGFDNDHSAILRKGQEVALSKPGTESVIPRVSGIHHRWFYIRAERHGNSLRFSVDNGKMVDLQYTDPDPLPGRRLAIWTWDCGIMFSRVRTSGPGQGLLEPLDFLPGLKCASPYPDE